MSINGISGFSGGMKLPSKIKSDATDMTSAIKSSTTKHSSWKESYLERVKEQAAKDFANGVRMGDEYKAMEKGTMTKYVSPDRAGPIAQTTASMNAALDQLKKSGDTLIDYFLKLANGGRADISVGQYPNAEIYDQNGECIASYNCFSGWAEHQTTAERAFWRESADTYIAAWNEAKAAAQQTAAPAVSGDASASFDVKA
jgi:hypothetical protein